MAKDDTTLGVLAHVLGILIGWLGPLIIYLVADNENVKNHARAALNWQLSLIIYLLISFVLMFVLIGFLTALIVLILDLVFSIMAAVKAGEGKVWKYPMAIPFFKVQ